MQRSAAGLGLLMLLVASLIAACGGGRATPTPAAAASDGSGGLATEEPQDTDTPGGTKAPAATSDPGTEPGDGPTAADTCGLVTVAEMEGLFGVSGVVQELFPGPPDTCDYQLDSAPFVAMTLTPDAAPFLFEAMAGDAASTMIDGIGDRALYNSQHLLLLVEKGDAILSIAILDESRTEEERAELMEQIGAIAAGRM